MAVRCTGAIVAAVALMRGGHRTRSVFVAFAAVRGAADDPRRAQHAGRAASRSAADLSA